MNAVKSFKLQHRFIVLLIGFKSIRKGRRGQGHCEPSDRSDIPAEAASAGFYHSEIMNADYPKLQVLTVKGLLEGTERLLIPQIAPDDVTFKRAEKIDKDKEKQGKLDV